ncbi:apolipoprotein D-like [Convolutriloba macropyga]|uniref:apolipoprotein D-like n=1 Tax=Convolutriloba macropyga TaxID=536237 RepID=UPI003F526C77
MQEVSGTYVKVNNTGYGNGEYSGVVGKAIQPDPPLAALIVSFAGYPSALADKPNYNIIALDTSSYALIYVCDDFLDLGSENAWILARDKTLDPTIVDTLRGNLTSLGVDLTKMHITNQDPGYCPPV